MLRQVAIRMDSPKVEKGEARTMAVEKGEAKLARTQYS